MKEQSASIYFDDEPKISLNGQYEKMKPKRNTLAPEDHINSSAWQIDNLNKLMIKMDSNQEGVLSMILDIQKTYTEYLEQANKADKQNDKIRIQALRFEQDFHINNEERKQAITLLQE